MANDPAEPGLSNGESPIPTDAGLKFRLYVMMFLQYFVQGCYLPIISVYLEDGLGFSPWQIGAFGSALAVGPLVAPFIIGQLVDRHVSTERVLSFCHVAGGVIMLALFRIDVLVPDGASLFLPVAILGTAYSTLYVPSMMLTNSLTFHHLNDREREFPLVRLWGTIGFIVPAWLIEPLFLSGFSGQELNEARGIVLAFAGVSGLIMGAYSLSLPHTPPAEEDRKDIAPGKVLGLLRSRNFLSLVLISLLVAVVHKFYFVWNPVYLKGVLREGGVTGAWEQRISSVGQVCEIAVMAVLGLLIKRLGFKWTMTLGTLAYVVRCLIFSAAISIDAPFPMIMSMVCVGQALHGFCFGCFLAAAFIYVDRVCTPDVRGSMQNFYGTFVIGLGMFLGGFIAGGVGDLFTTPVGSKPSREQWGIESRAGLVATHPKEGEAPKLHDWPGIWLAGGAIAMVALLAFVASFPQDKRKPPPDDAGEKERE